MKLNSSTIQSAIKQMTKSKKGFNELTDALATYRLKEAQQQGFSKPKAIKLYKEFLKLSKIFN